MDAQLADYVISISAPTQTHRHTEAGHARPSASELRQSHPDRPWGRRRRQRQGWGQWAQAPKPLPTASSKLHRCMGGSNCLFFQGNVTPPHAYTVFISYFLSNYIN